MIFDNCLIQAPDGVKLSRCGRKKLQWYLDRNLADLVSDNPPTIQLRFEPSGRKCLDDPLLLDGKPNLCVVCGTSEDLTKHHIIPYSFIRHMALEYKVDIIRDIFPLCKECHNTYEKKSLDKRQELADRFGVPLYGLNNETLREIRHASGSANTLIKFGDLIPERRKEMLRKIVQDFLGKDNLTEEDLLKVKNYKPNSDEEYVSFSKHVALQTEDYSAFAQEWRKHFVTTMQPKFMPEKWKVDRQTKEVWVPHRMRVK